MPRLPILRRSAMYVRNHANGMLRHLDFNLVQTTLGAMIEPRTLYRPGENIKNDAFDDTDYNDVVILDEFELAQYRDSPLQSLQWPRTH